MAAPRRTAVVALVAALLVALAATGVWLRLGEQNVSGPTGAKTSFPDLTPASGDPQLPSLAALHPKAGTVVPAAGPFDDRFTLSELQFDGKAVSGKALITSDVSDVLEFEALAGFYDGDGVLLGTARHSYHLDETAGHPEHEGPPDEAQSFTIAVPADLTGRAVSAAVGVPVLVNE